LLTIRYLFAQYWQAINFCNLFNKRYCRTFQPRWQRLGVTNPSGVLQINLSVSFAVFCLTKNKRAGREHTYTLTFLSAPF